MLPGGADPRAGLTAPDEAPQGSFLSALLPLSERPFEIAEEREDEPYVLCGVLPLPTLHRPTLRTPNGVHRSATGRGETYPFGALVMFVLDSLSKSVLDEEIHRALNTLAGQPHSPRYFGNGAGLAVGRCDDLPAGTGLPGRRSDFIPQIHE